MYNAIASLIMSQVLSSAKREVIKKAKAQISKAQREGVRKEVLYRVATQYAREAEHNFSMYIESLGAAEVSVEFQGKPGQALINKAEQAVRELGIYIEKQSQDGAVISFLKKRYAEEGINIVTGRLYAGHYVNKKSQGAYEVGNSMFYASKVDKNKPWLSGKKTTQGIEEMLANAASEIFELTFEDVDLSSDLALLKFSQSAGKGFKDEVTSPSSPNKPARRNPRKKKKR